MDAEDRGGGWDSSTTDTHGWTRKGNHEVRADGTAVPVSGGSLNLSWPANHLGWSLQVQTNSRSVGLSNNWFTVPGSSTLTATNFPVSPAAPTVFYRLVLP